MKVTIITVCYNSASTIEDCIRSVQEQKYANLEHIIIDGKSSDATLEIVGRFNNETMRIVSEPDQGIYDAMNKGILLATGDIVGILNSDDFYADENVIKDVIHEFCVDPELDILYGDLMYVNKENTQIVRKWFSESYYKNFFEHGNVPPHPALFLRQNVYKQAGSFNLQYKLAADYEFMLRIFKKYKFKSKYVKRLMVKMRLGGATNKNIKNIFDGNKEILKAWPTNGFKAPLMLMPLRIIRRLVQFI